MKKRGNHENKTVARARHNETNDTDDKKNAKNDKKDERLLSDDVHNQGFSEWLRSSDGLEMMRLFVIANSILIFFTMGLPKMQELISTLKEYYYSE
ncbi:PREDICTED: uncharacterized protein LOC108577580 [Habropoda laboriosa]|nr:PREDICTED: uncharacterized protein LOC108577580 [Habropoda laboriosa]